LVPTPGSVISHQSGWMIDEDQKTVRGTVFPRRGELGVHVAGVEIEEARIGIQPLADVAVALGGGGQAPLGGQVAGPVAIGPVDRPLHPRPGGIRHPTDGTLAVVVDGGPGEVYASRQAKEGALQPLRSIQRLQSFKDLNEHGGAEFHGYPFLHFAPKNFHVLIPTKQLQGDKFVDLFHRQLLHTVREGLQDLVRILRARPTDEVITQPVRKFLSDFITCNHHGRLVLGKLKRMGGFLTHNS
jgi:hypothetical protein